jgi:polar amino acid transport system substrate-binding protein
MKQTVSRFISIAACIAAIAASSCGNGDTKTASSMPSASASFATVGGNLLEDVKRRGVLVVSTDADYKPQSYRNPDGSWVGFDVDVAREVARRLGVKPEFEDTNFDVITAGSWKGRWDVNVDSMAITKPRTRALWFTGPYYFVPASFAVNRASDAKSIADLAGKKLGVGTSTTYLDYLNGKMSTARVKPPHNPVIVTYDTDALALKDLGLGNGTRLNGVLTALPTIRSSIAAGLPLRVIEPPVFEDSSAIALDRNSPAYSAPLLWAIDGIIHDMHADGSLRRLSLKYYGIDLSIRR